MHGVGGCQSRSRSRPPSARSRPSPGLPSMRPPDWVASASTGKAARSSRRGGAPGRWRRAPRARLACQNAGPTPDSLTPGTVRKPAALATPRSIDDTGNPVSRMNRSGAEPFTRTGSTTCPASYRKGTGSCGTAGLRGATAAAQPGNAGMQSAAAVAHHRVLTTCCLAAEPKRHPPARQRQSPKC